MDTAEVDGEHGDEVVLRREFVTMVTFARHRMIFDGRWKLIYVPTEKGPRYFLFDTVGDPENLVDRSAEQPAVAAHLRELLWQWMLRDPKMEERHAFLAPVGVHLDIVDGMTKPTTPPDVRGP